MKLTPDIQGLIRSSGVLETLKGRCIEVLNQNSPKEHRDKWLVETSISGTGFVLNISHGELDPDQLSQYEYGEDESGVVYAPIRHVEIMLEMEAPDMILEAIL